MYTLGTKRYTFGNKKVYYFEEGCVSVVMRIIRILIFIMSYFLEVIEPPLRKSKKYTFLFPF